MKPRFPLYIKITGWFFLNLLFLGVVFYGLFKAQFQVDVDSMLLGRAGDRLQAVSDLIAAELESVPTNQWNGVLARFSAAYKVNFQLFDNEGVLMAGPRDDPPGVVKEKILERRGPRGPGPPFGRGMGPGRRGEGQHRGLAGKFLLQTDQPVRYWVGIGIPCPDKQYPKPGPIVLLASSASLLGGGLFVDFTPWVVVGFVALLCSVLFWLPLVRSLTRSISQMTAATENIAQGNFQARVGTARSDELGTLGAAINRMAQRLTDYVSGQKRLLGDIAHELRSPIARMQMALGILEQKASDAQKPYFEDLREELRETTLLVDELLAFSKASLDRAGLKLRPVSLADVAAKALRRESAKDARVECAIAPELQVLGDPDLLARALGNVVRNAIRYAGQAGPIILSARPAGGTVELSVADQGPGIPPESLARVFDPFFRVDDSRDRHTGGVGLGLSIVKTCVEACEGTVECRNRTPTGLEVLIRLKPAAGE